MLTVTETVQRHLTTDEQLALDVTEVFEDYLDAMNSHDKSMAIAYAKVLMLKAMCLWLMFKFIIHTLMHKSTLDLFSEQEDNRNEIDEAFDSALEERAAALEITVDYYIAEFLWCVLF